MKTFTLTVGGLGFMRPAPGTWGSLPPAGLAWLLLLFEAPSSVYVAALVVTCIVACACCVAFGDYAETRFGRKDASEVVVDETAGQCLPLLALAFFAPGYAGGFWVVSISVGACFVLFRIFDIIKPPPARQLESLPLGWGVLLDDIFAGLYAAGVAVILAFFGQVLLAASAQT